MKLEEAIPLYLYFASKWRNGIAVYDEREGKLFADAQKTIFAEASRLLAAVNPDTPKQGKLCVDSDGLIHNCTCAQRGSDG